VLRVVRGDSRVARRSLWLDEALVGEEAAPPLEGAVSADVCIVGGGFTGRWTAPWLKEREPSLDAVPISRADLRPRDLPAQDLEFMAQHQQLNVFHMQAAAAANKRTEQSPHSEVEKREDHAADPPSPRPEERRHQFWRPSGVEHRTVLTLSWPGVG